MYQRALVPLDGSPVAEAAVEVASRLISSEHGELVLVRVQEYSQESQWSELPILSEAFDLEKKRCADYLAMVGQRWRTPARLVRCLVLEYDLQTALVLSRAAETYACDLVVLTSHGRSGFERVLAGSVAEKMARGCSRPVMILGPQTAEVRRIKAELSDMSNSSR